MVYELIIRNACCNTTLNYGTQPSKNVIQFTPTLYSYCTSRQCYVFDYFARCNTTHKGRV